MREKRNMFYYCFSIGYMCIHCSISMDLFSEEQNNKSEEENNKFYYKLNFFFLNDFFSYSFLTADEVRTSFAVVISFQDGIECVKLHTPFFTEEFHEFFFSASARYNY